MHNTMYTAMYLPVDRPWTDGCMYLTSSGDHHEWDAADIDAQKVKEKGKVADLFIVGYEYNQLRIVGQPSAAAKRWIKPGMQFKQFNVVATEDTVYHGNRDVATQAGGSYYTQIVNIRCEVCKHMSEK